MSVQVAPLVPFLTMKRIVLEGRRKAKDAYDIYFVLQNYSGGVDEVVKACRPHLKLGLVQTSGLSWCDQKETGLCDQKENNDRVACPQRRAV